METIAERLLVLVPGAFVVIVTLVILLRHVNQQNERWVKAHKECSSASTKSANKCSDVVEENTKMLGRVGSLIEQRIRQTGGRVAD